MRLGKNERHALGVALNEADLLEVEVDPQCRTAAATFRVLTLPKKGPAPEDRRVHILFRPVGRVVVSLRLENWDGRGVEHVEAPLLEIDELLSTVQSFGGAAVYGYDFFDSHDQILKNRRNHLSLDWNSGTDGLQHSVTLFQEVGKRYLDLIIWFDEMQIRAPDASVISIAKFCAGGKRWWDGLYSGDSRTQGVGISPIGDSGAYQRETPPGARG